MNQNYEIIKIAQSLGLNIQGLTEEEQISHIAEQLGLKDYNPIYDFDELLNRLNYLDHQNQIDMINNLNNDSMVMPQTSNIPANFGNNQFRNNQMSSFLSNNPNNSKDEEAIKRINRNKNINNYNQQVYNRNQQINEEQSNQQNETDKNISKNKTNKNRFKSMILPSLKKSSKNGLKKNSDEIPVSASGIIEMPAAVIGGVLIAIVAFVILIAIFIAGFTSKDDKSELNKNEDVTSYITGNASTTTLTDALVYLNLCSSNKDSEKEETECLESNVGKFFTHVKELYDSYQRYEDRNGNPVTLDIDLLLETISYGVTDDELFADKNFDNIMENIDKLADAQVEKYQEVGDLYKSNGSVVNDSVIVGSNGERTYYRISYNKYVSYLLYGEVHENYDGRVKVYDSDIHPDSDTNYVPEGRTYKFEDYNQTTSTNYSGEVKDGYLYKQLIYDYNIKEEDILEKSKEIVIEIYERANENNYSNGIISSISCPGVVVTGEYAGVYSLEDYVARVVQNENNWYVGDNIENMKAQAVAARTYVLRITDYCTSSIENSPKFQTMSDHASEQAIRAANETAGQILVNDDGSLAHTQYDAFALKEKTADFYILKQADLHIPVEWVESKITDSQLEYYAAHNHGNGMSQWGSRYLQTKGYTYNQILDTFYTSGLSSLGSSITNNIPMSVNDLRNRYYFTYDINAYQGNTLFAQCVWYAKHRALEIIASSSLDEATKQTYIKSIEKTGGNGQDWYANPDSTYFRKSTNINDARAGAIVSWTRGKYGHVAIIEAVYTNSNGETMVTLTEGWRTKGASGDWYVTNDLWSVTNFRKKDMTLSQLQTYSGSFNGYVYLY